MQLFERERHESLCTTPWSEPAAREAIARIIADTQAAFAYEALWPIHPLDVSPERPALALKPLFNGAAGVIWTLSYLQELGAADPQHDYSDVIAQLLDAHRADDRELQRAAGASFPVGDAGLLLLQMAALVGGRTVDVAAVDSCGNALERVLRTAGAGESLGFAWGVAGALLAAQFAFEITGSARWRVLSGELADAIWSEWCHEPRYGGYFWHRELYGFRDRQLCALHGLSGVVFALARGKSLLGESRYAELVRRTYATLKGTALLEGNFANWPMLVGPSDRPTKDVRLLQQCIGAPGVVTSVAGLPVGFDAEMDALLLAAGELVWHAGPTTKLPSICHGAPGSGYAFLKLFTRTADERWLARARAFAMHGIEQAERAKTQFGQRKYSLWTGDLGLAVFLLDCLRGEARMPLLDVF